MSPHRIGVDPAAGNVAAVMTPASSNRGSQQNGLSRIVVLTYDSLPSNLITAAIAREFPGKVVAVFSAVGRPSLRETVRLFWKSPVFFIWKASEILAHRVSTVLRFRSGRSPTLSAIARSAGADYIGIKMINDAEVVDSIEEYSPDVIVSVHFPQKIGNRILNSARKAAINTHGSYLPHNRGLFPYFWTIARNDGHGGVSVHHLDEDWDTGAVIVQERLHPEDGETVASYSVRCAELSSRLVVEAIAAVGDGSASASPQLDGSGSYASWPTLSDSRELWRTGGKLGSPFLELTRRRQQRRI